MDAARAVVDLADLPEILEEYRDAPFEWGTMDCCLFAASVRARLSGIDHASRFRGTYRTRHGAAKLIFPRGNLSGFVDHVLGEGQPALMARRGDFVLGPVPEPALGICTGANAVFKGDRTLISVPLTHCSRSWSCPAQ